MKRRLLNAWWWLVSPWRITPGSGDELRASIARHPAGKGKR